MNYMRNKTFVDSNILIYAYVTSNKSKHIKAREMLYKEIFNDEMLLSTQILSEFTSVLFKYKMPIIEIEYYFYEIINSIIVVNLSTITLSVAYDIKKRYKFSWWDSIIVATALENDCNILLTEDLQHNQVIEGRLQVINPFL